MDQAPGGGGSGPWSGGSRCTRLHRLLLLSWLTPSPWSFLSSLGPPGLTRLFSGQLGSVLKQPPVPGRLSPASPLSLPVCPLRSPRVSLLDVPPLPSWPLQTCSPPPTPHPAPPRPAPPMLATVTMPSWRWPRTSPLVSLLFPLWNPDCLGLNHVSWPWHPLP